MVELRFINQTNKNTAEVAKAIKILNTRLSAIETKNAILSSEAVPNNGPIFLALPCLSVSFNIWCFTACLRLYGWVQCLVTTFRRCSDCIAFSV